MYDQAITNYLALIKERHQKWMDERKMLIACPEYQVDKGRRYDKIVEVRETGGHSVHSFVEKSTGDIFLPASWRTPAKHARGSIYDNPERALNPNDWMVRYL